MIKIELKIWRKIFAILIAFGFVSTGLTGQDNTASSKWKLKPLEYHHPGLTVDLGVGLWAWPLPLDYDGDGDLDLLVSCPDKPSNGVYFFENPSQNPKLKNPIFKPGVRVGNSSQNLQISYVNGEPRILKPAYEVLRNSETKQFDFSTPKKIYEKGNVHENKTRGNMWRYVDFDGDDDHDLIIGAGDWTDYGWDNAYDRQGKWKNGPLHGFVYLVENLGSDTKPEYSPDPKRIKAAGADIDVYGWPSPNFGDFDNDGDLDLICGEFLDGFTYFQNSGSRTNPEYSAGIRLQTLDGRRLAMDLQMITPTAVDWDSDGDLDLVVGDEDGRVALVENSGRFSDGTPVFHRPVYFRQEADTLKFGALATPFAIDWDQDGDEDILCGNTAGQIGLFENLGPTKSGLPKWGEVQILDVDGAPFRVMAGDNGSIQGPCEAKWGYTTLSVTDWDQDGDPDILFNSIWSKVEWIENRNGKLTRRKLNGESESPPKWYWWKTDSSAALTQWRTTPIGIDFDKDKKVDLVMLDQDGFLTLRRNGKRAERIFVDESLNPLRLNYRSCGGSGRVKLAVADWDGDSRLDIIVNSSNATWYRNCKTVDGKIVLKRIGDLARRNVSGHTSSPAVCDFDKDGKPDLLVGSENGRIYHIAHDDCVRYTDEQLVANMKTQRSEPRFPGLVKEEFVFTKAKFPQCHASSICQTSRGLVVTWFGGTREKAKDVGVWVSYHDGRSWSAPKEWANGVQHENLRHPCWNPVLFQTPGNGPTLLFFKVGPDPKSWWGEMMTSYDGGRTFRDRVRLPETIDGPVRCKPILVNDNKTLLCGSSTEYDRWRVHFEKVNLDGGKPSGTWKRIGPINDGKKYNAIQPTFLRHNDGKLQVLCRTREGVIVTSFSDDEGDSWTELEPTNLPNPNSGVEVVTLKDGRHLLIYNHLGTGKTGWGRRGLLNLAISKDGKLWRKVAVVENEQKSEFSYPAIIQTGDGLVHLTYTWKRQRIKHVVIDPAKIETGSALSLDNWFEETK